MFCKNCGASISEKDSFCSNCGTKIEHIDIDDFYGKNVDTASNNQAINSQAVNNQNYNNQNAMPKITVNPYDTNNNENSNQNAGNSWQRNNQQSPRTVYDEFNETKIGWGILAALFLGLIGLIIGFCEFPAETVARKSFVKGWGITTGICVGMAIVVVAIVFVVLFSLGKNV